MCTKFYIKILIPSDVTNVLSDFYWWMFLNLFSISSNTPVEYRWFTYYITLY